MKDYGLIREAYSETEKYYIKRIDDAVSRNDRAGHLKLLELSRINEYAYFVLLWGQFESFINDRAFEIEGDNFGELGFMLRVQLTVSSTHEYYPEIDQYYYWRCKIAHGRIAEFPELTLPTIFDKIEEITDAISKNPLPLGEDFIDMFKDEG
jgi:hypothetical protein